jgi:hypothetical protein
MIGVLAATTFALGFKAVAALYVIPYWMFVVWLDVVTYLHHHGPQDAEEEVPWYRGEVRPVWGQGGAGSGGGHGGRAGTAPGQADRAGRPGTAQSWGAEPCLLLSSCCPHPTPPPPGVELHARRAEHD